MIVLIILLSVIAIFIGGVAWLFVSLHKQEKELKELIKNQKGTGTIIRW